MKMIGQLMWKEGREHWWKMGALLGLVLAPMVAVMCWIALAPAGERRGGEGYDVVMILGCWLVPIWVGAWTATGEKTRGTLGMLGSLPTRRWKVFGMKSAWGLATVLAPLAVGMALVDFVGWAAERRGMEMWLGLATATSFYLMIVALTAGIRKEGMAAMVGLLLVLGSGLWAAVAGAIPVGWLQTVMMIPNPFFPQFAGDQVRLGWEFHDRDLLVLWVMLAVHGCFSVMWWGIGAWRFGRQGRGALERRGGDGVQTKLKAGGKIGPGRFWLGAHLWRERREQGWIVACMGLAALGIAAMGSLVSTYFATSSLDREPSMALHNFVELSGFMAMVVPTLLAIILGVGSMAGDLEPRVIGFWRSRPMRIGAFFWSKYGVSLSGIGLLFAVLLGASMVGDYYVVSRFVPPERNDIELSKSMPGDHVAVPVPREQGIIRHMPDIVWMAGWLPLALTVTMLFYALVRRAIYAVVLAVAVLAAMFIGTVMGVERFDWPPEGVEWLMRVAAILGIAVAAGLAVLTRVALERDWCVRGARG